MKDYFKMLSNNEWQELQDTVPLIGILIAGADGNIEDKEVSWSKKVAHIRSYKLKGGLKTFYEEVNLNYEARFNHFIQELPWDAKERTTIISKKLSHINVILAKLDPVIGSKLYKSFVSFAEQVAKASGGVMGFFSINKDESQLISLSMIDPILANRFEEEE
ncbi:MAG: hypothetical protein IPL55_08385 [Saprospiraceae bacterium]|jgi:hypothetical protein|nr:hypothetical protein [Saprospiraceae bacterium]